MARESASTSEFASETYLSYLKSERAQAIFRLSQRVADLLRAYLGRRNFIEFQAPVISSVTDPVLGAQPLPVLLYNRKAYVTSSMVFHKQVLATAFDRVYSFAPNVRLEPLTNANSGRHLVEFCQLDVEEADATLDDSIELAEEMLSEALALVAQECSELLHALGRRLRPPKAPFRRLAYDEALSLSRSLGVTWEWGEDIPESAETLISQEIGEFFWITDYPKACRSFYYRQLPGEDRVRSMDLVFPEGYGEAISGGEREHCPLVISRRLEESGLHPCDFQEFLTMAESGLRPTSGFGIGLERLVRYITGERKISRVRPFPKTPGQVQM